MRYAHSNDDAKRRAVNKLPKGDLRADGDKTVAVVARTLEKAVLYSDVDPNALKSGALRHGEVAEWSKAAVC